MKNRDVASLLNGYVRNLNESEWLDVLKYLVQKLGESTSAHIEIGDYWISDEPNDSSTSLGTRVRAKSPLPGVESDYWEASLCLTAQDNTTYVDAFVFPYLDGIRVSQFGRLDSELAIENGGEITWWFNFANGEFQSRGWNQADGPGEWDWIVEKGDAFMTSLNCRILQNTFQTDEPILVDVNIENLSQLLADAKFLKYKQPRLSLINVNRNRELTNLVPWNVFPPKPDSEHPASIENFSIINSKTLRIDLRQFNIRGGWISGKYRLSLRLQNESKGESYSSQASPPINFCIL